MLRTWRGHDGGHGGLLEPQPAAEPEGSRKPHRTGGPLFLIYADRGQGGEELSADFYEVAGEPKQLWKTDSEHIGGYDAAPVEYERRVVRFFSKSLSVPSS